METVIFLWIGLSLVVGFIGETRDGKFWTAFLTSLILSPIISGILTLLIKKKDIPEQDPKSAIVLQPSYVRYGIILGIILILTLPFHYVPLSLMVFPKDNFTFSNTFIFQADIDKLIEKYNTSSVIEKISIMNSTLFKKLSEKGIIYNLNTPENTDMNHNLNQQELPINNESTVINDTNTQQYSEEDNKIIEKIKAKVKRDYPSDYNLQKLLFDGSVEAYFYMQTVPDLEIKRKLQKNYPLDFTLQKLMYNQEVDAKEQMK